jgi:signal transduction histidine kinase/tetratricopeptide (TPR) repeat protein
MKKLIVLLLLCGPASYSQKEGQKYIDSLVATLPRMKEDTSKVNTLNDIAYSYWKFDPKTGQKFAQQGIDLSRKIGWKDGLALSYRNLGINYIDNSDFKKAIEYYNMAYESTTNKKILCKVLQSLGLVYTYQSDYKTAMNYSMRSLKMCEEVGNRRGVAAVLSNIGIIHYDLQNFPKAIEYQKRALVINRELNVMLSVAGNLGNLGNSYSSLKQHEKAIDYYKQAIAISEKFGEKFGMSLGYSAIAGDYFELKQYENAMTYITKALQLSRELEDDRNIANETGIMGDILLEMAKLPKYKNQSRELLQQAIGHFEESLLLQKKLGSIKDVFTNYKQLSDIYAILGQYPKALEMSRLSVIYKDSIFNADTKETIKNLEDKRTIELRDKQIQLNKATLQTKEKEQWLYISGIAFLLIIAGLILMQSRNRKKNNEKLQRLNLDLDHANKIKARFFSILNHDLRSPVSSLINFLHLQKESPELLDAESKKRMENKTIASAENLLDSMEDLLLWSKGQMENFKPQPTNVAVSLIFDDLQKHFSSIENVKLIFENPDNIKVFTDENYLKTILRNLTGNAIKALEKTPGATIVLNAFQADGKVRISVKDNGPGGTMEKFRALYDENEVVGIKTGLGLHLIRDLAKAIDCSVLVETQPGVGTTFILSF